MEEIAMLPLWITCIVVLPVLALVFYVVRRSKPGRFRLSATLLKLVSINIEVDAQDKPDELPGTAKVPDLPWPVTLLYGAFVSGPKSR
jgi:hypothetical protein